MPRQNHPITVAEASRSIYLDFEGPGPPKRSAPAPPPVLGGILIDKHYSWSIVDNRLKQVADGRNVPLVQLVDYLEKIITRARTEARRIIYWTSHEESLFRDHGFPPEEYGFDLKIEVKPYFKKLFAESKKADRELFSATKSKKAKLRQKAFGLCVQCAEEHPGEKQFKVPTTYGKGMVGSFIRKALDQCEKKESYDDWSKSAKKNWSRLISHNRLDCRAMDILMKNYGFEGAPFRRELH
jgi:hypothetical protein